VGGPYIPLEERPDHNCSDFRSAGDLNQIGLGRRLSEGERRPWKLIWDACDPATRSDHRRVIYAQSQASMNVEFWE
jgi:hypothetical protein